MINIGKIQVNQTEKKQCYLPVYNTGLELPATIICGAEPGETVLLTSGIHCAEYPGIEASIRLAATINPVEIKGNIIFIHAVNISGFTAGGPTSLIPEDGQNLNRVFPGDPAGTLSYQLADYVVRELHSVADYYIDMHGGDVQESLTPYVYYAAGSAAGTTARSQQMAMAANVPYMVGSRLTSKGSYNYAAACKIPAILLERGCGGVWSETEVQHYQEDVRNILRTLKVLDDQVEAVAYEPIDLDEVIYRQAAHQGLWYPRKKAGERVVKGELLGCIRDFFGAELESYHAEFDGVILYQACALSIKAGADMVVYGKID